MGPTPVTPTRASTTAQQHLSNSAPASSKEYANALTLTHKEQEIFELLGRVLHDEKLTDLTLRVAGGWVRDKILKKEKAEVDIDIALDKLLGREFAEIVNNWMEKNGHKTASVGVIQRNPDQSKHLETATMRVLDVWLDLVNLRTETYTEDSRIPEMAIGTPAEDAMRRDLTINSLFYNINTGLVEDFTGRGFTDIHARLVRTPLPPLTTLLDDPLRTLRAIRFASRLNFRFDPELFAACGDATVLAALDAKVSRERVRTEMHGMMGSARPAHAVGLLVELGLFPVVFRLPVVDEAYVGDVRPPQNLPEVALDALVNLEAVHNLPVATHDTEMLRLAAVCERPRLTAYAALLAPIANVVVVGKKRRPITAAHHVLADELRMSTRDVATVVTMHAAAVRFRSLVARHAQDAEAVSRLDVGLVLRDAGPLWRAALQVALAAELPPLRRDEGYSQGVDEKHVQVKHEAMSIVERYARFMMYVERLGLEGVWDLRPAVDGREMLGILPRLRKGRQVGVIMKRQVEWMIEHPGVDAESVRRWLKSEYSELAEP